MSVGTVARKDLTSMRRSRALWAAGTVLVLFTVLFAYWTESFGVSEREAVVRLFSTLTMAIAVVLPIVALVASYLAIAGERRSGGIKFLLGVPNSRRDVFLGKLASRVGLVAGGLAFAFVAASSIAVARHGALPARTVLGLLAVSLVYATIWVGIGVSLSAAVAARGRAIAAAFGSYFVLIIVFALPFGLVPSFVRWLNERLLGLEPNQHLYDATTHVSPYIAFRKAANLAFPEAEEAQLFRRSAEAGADLPVYLTDEFSLVVLGLWLVVPAVIGYRRFQRLDLD